MNCHKEISPLQADEVGFYEQVAGLLSTARSLAKRQMDNVIVTTYYEIGRMIVEREQQGQRRAQYGRRMLQGLSEYLTKQYGRGFSVVNLQSMRKFYQVYAPSIQNLLADESELNISVRDILGGDIEKQQSVTAKFKLSWTHYQILMRIENEQVRRFYEIETESQQWSVRQLQRQVETVVSKTPYDHKNA